MSSIIGFFSKHRNKLIMLGVFFAAVVVFAVIYVYWKGKQETSE